MPTVNLTLTGQALSKVDDTNVTLTLGGTPLTALLKATSITVGWTGQLSVARGGTGLGALGTANQLLRVNALGTALEYFTPSYGTGTVTSFAFTDSTGITGSVLNATTTPTLSLSLTSAAVGLGNVENTALSTWAGSTNLVTLGAAVTGAGSLTLGTSSSVAGTLVLKNATNAFTQTIRGTNPAASIIYDLPTTAPTLGQVLSATAPAAGVVTLSWATAASGITVGTTTITSGTDKRVPYNNSGVYGELANFTIGAVAAGVLDVPAGLAVAGTQILKWSSGGNLFLGSSTPPIYTNAGSTIIGNSAGINNTGSQNVFLGFGAGVNSGTASQCIFLGYTNWAASTANVIGSIFIGYEAAVTASHQGVLGSKNANGYVDNWYFNGVTHSSAYSVVLNASGGSGTNNAGANITIAGGRGTGTAAGGNNVEQTSVKTSSGTTLQALTDRHNIVGKYVDITAGSAQTFGNLALTTSGTIAGGIIVYTVEANDGTDYQSLTGTAPYSVVNKAGTLTYVLGTDVQSSACSTGTLAGTLGLSASGTTLRFQMNAVSSLTETVLRISFQVLNQFGVATITAA